MWSLLTRPRSAYQHRLRSLAVPTSRKRHSVRLSLERLETRDCPSGVTLDSFSAVIMNMGKQVELTGTTQDAEAGTVVVFSGKVVGAATVDAEGRFDVIETASGLGTITASVSEFSAISIDLWEMPPGISIDNVVYGNQQARTVTVIGSVAAAQKGGRTVTLGGVLTGSAVTNSEGVFSYTGNASGPGYITAQTTDIWGQESNVAQYWVNGIVPVITNFQITRNGYGQWVASGTVTGGDVNGIGVAIGGITSGSGTVNGGSFSIIVGIGPGAFGTVTAVATNGWGLFSTTATYYY